MNIYFWLKTLLLNLVFSNKGMTTVTRSRSGPAGRDRRIARSLATEEAPVSIPWSSN